MNLFALSEDILSVHKNLTLSGIRISGDYLEEGCLSCSVHTKQTKALPRRDGEGAAVQRNDG